MNNYMNRLIWEGSRREVELKTDAYQRHYTPYGAIARTRRTLKGKTSC
ncbi:MAG: hypothetical protein Q7T25_02530 [Sideroxyarcus sp.]|nr:hypothetical protein [Sideroxyarcus sp.]